MKNYNESMLESMSNGVIILDENDIIVARNIVGARIMKSPPSAILWHGAAEFFRRPVREGAPPPSLGSPVRRLYRALQLPLWPTRLARTGTASA
jgi:PAS domain-containing protein